MHNPVLWAHECITWPAGTDCAPYQNDILNRLAQKRRVAMRGLHGTGKSTTASLAVLWFATTRDAMGIDWKIPTTASAWRHLSTYLWPEIKKWSRLINWDMIGRPPFSELSELLALNLKLKHGAASAVASNRAELIEGAHADSLLYIIDEGKVVPNDTWGRHRRCPIWWAGDGVAGGIRARPLHARAAGGSVLRHPLSQAGL